MQKLNYLIFLLIQVCTINAKSHGQVKTLTIKSNIKELSILKDGIRIGGAGDKLSIKPGLNIIEISAVGYRRRALNVWNTGWLTDQMNVTLLKKDGKSQTPPRMAPIKRLRKTKPLKSVCRLYRLQKQCQRRTWWDDLAFSGFFLYFPKDISRLGSPAISLSNLPPMNRPRSKKNLDYISMAEYTLASHPDKKLAYTIAASEALFNRNCDRVKELVKVAAAAGKASPQLYLRYGLCLEAIGNNDQAYGFLRTLAKKMRNAQTEYHIGRLLLGKNPGKAYNIAEKCLEHFPGSYPCLELEQQAKLMQSKLAPKAIQKFRTFHKKQIFTLDKKLRNSKTTRKTSAILGELFQEIPNSFEYYGHKIRLGMPLSKMEMWIVNFSVTTNRFLSQKLLQEIERKKKTSPAMLTVLYKTAYTHDPKSIFFIWGYAKALEKSYGCQTTLEFLKEVQKTPTKLPKTLKFMEARCALQSGKLEQAQNLYQKIIKENTNDWKAHYNLGVVYDKLDQRQKAEQHYLEAWVQAPKGTDTSSIRKRLKENPKFLDKAGKKNKEKMGEHPLLKKKRSQPNNN